MRLTPLLFCFMLFTSLIPQISQAQLGIKAGLNITSAEFLNVGPELKPLITDPQSELGLHVGLYYEKAFSDKFSGTIELQYTQKGFSIGNLNPNEPKDFPRLHYLSIPLMFYYYHSEKLALGLGTETALLLSSELSNSKIDLSEIYDQSLDLGLNFGAKYQIIDRLWIEGRFTLGVLSISEINFTDENGQPLDEINLVNRQLQFGLAYDLFGL